MKLAADDLPAYRTGIALLAVHSAISLNDAIAAGLTGKAGRHQDHLTAAAELERSARKHRISNLNGVSHLRRLLAEKTASLTVVIVWTTLWCAFPSVVPNGFTCGLTLISRRFSMLRQVLSEEQQHARVQNAVANFLFSALIVPKIFFNARWPTRKEEVDILAVDRSGAGEIHVVEVKVGSADLVRSVRSIIEVPAHFRYLALFGNASFRPTEKTLYAADGMGRVGIIQVRESPQGDLCAEFAVRPERFRLDSSYFRQIDRFTAARPADMEIRP